MRARSATARTRTMGGLISLLREYEERYIILHQHTFPGVLRRIRASHIRNYSIFLKDGLLFSHFEYRGNNFAADMAAMADDGTTKDWWKLTEPMQQPLPTRKDGEWWTTMESVARLASRPVTSAKFRRYAFVTRLKHGTESALRTALAETPPGIGRTITSARFRNVHLYRHDVGLYLYAEYAGSDIEADFLHLSRSKPFGRWRASIEELCEPGSVWEQMKEVFHTH